MNHLKKLNKTVSPSRSNIYSSLHVQVLADLPAPNEVLWRLTDKSFYFYYYFLNTSINILVLFGLGLQLRSLAHKTWQLTIFFLEND